MIRMIVAAFAALLATTAAARAGDQDRNATAVIDRAIAAMGGEERLSRFKAFSARGRGVVVMDGNDVPFTFDTTVNGLSQYRSAFEVNFSGAAYSAATVIDGDKGWRKLIVPQKLGGEALADEKRVAYLQLMPFLLTSLKGADYQSELAGEETLDGKKTAVVRVKGPDGKDFTAHFDKESGLMVKLTGKVVTWEREQVNQETTFEEYQDFGGVRAATVSRSTRDGKPYVELEEMEYQPLDEVKPETFAEPR